MPCKEHVGMSASLVFGPEMRRLRQERGISLREFATLVGYHKAHLSKVERGLRRASVHLARRADSTLNADGRLQSLAEKSSARSSGDTTGGRRGVGRRELLAAGTGTLLGSGTLTGLAPTPTAVEHLRDEEGGVVAAFRAQLDQMRQLGQRTDPALLLPLLKTQTHTVTEFAARGGAGARSQLLVLAARFAEYAGWMAQESGDTETALTWTADAVALAQAGGDRALSSYALVRRALVTFYAGEAQHTVDLARGAQDSGLPPRIRALAAQREAQGHALAGDEHACRESLDRARLLFTSAFHERDPGPVIGTSHLSDPVTMITGWCLHDLGRPREAAEVLDRECLRVPRQAFRTRTRYGLRRALAHVANGEIEHGCDIAGELLDIVATAPSATVRTDLSRLARELTRFRANRAVRDLQPALALALRPAAAR
ncbi:helix-turn-helix domain-containing protein [Streptomyces clavuligerus]|nr:helix-turn-helix transcriptional regulator [Streptomyces clavuligerus]